MYRMTTVVLRTQDILEWSGGAFTTLIYQIACAFQTSWMTAKVLSTQYIVLWACCALADEIARAFQASLY